MQLNSFLTDIFYKVWFTSATLRSCMTLAHSETIRQLCVTRSLTVHSERSWIDQTPWNKQQKNTDLRPRPQALLYSGLSQSCSLQDVSFWATLLLIWMTGKVSFPVFPWSVLPVTYHEWSYVFKLKLWMCCCLLKRNSVSIVISDACHATYLSRPCMLSNQSLSLVLFLSVLP